MGSVQWAITVSPELARAIDRLAKRRDDSRSGLIEVLLREHALVQGAIDPERDAVQRPPPPAPPQRESAGHKNRLVVKGEVRL